MTGLLNAASLPATHTRTRTRTRSELMGLLSAELLKVRTVRAPTLLAVASLAVTVIMSVQPVVSAGRTGAPSVGTAALLLAVLSAAARGPVLMLVAGVLLVSVERRHATLTATLLQTPHRSRLVTAKALVAAICGLGVGLVGTAAAVLVALGSGAMTGSLLNADVALLVIGQLVAYPLYAVIGVGVGALLSASSPVAVLVPVLWFLLLESVVGTLSPALSPWLPGRLASALANSGDLADLAPVWAGFAGLLGYAVLLTVAGASRLTRLDVM